MMKIDKNIKRADPKELCVCEYFGWDYRSIYQLHENDPITTDFGHLVNLLALWEEKLSPKKRECVEIKIDKSTLPKDGQSVKIHVDNMELRAVFCEGDDLFLIDKGCWFTSFQVQMWEPIDL